jgi:hypothetical protein
LEPVAVGLGVSGPLQPRQILLRCGENAEFLAPAGTPNRTLSWSKTNSAAKAISAYEKTGSSRRADLVKLVAGYVSPLGG